MTDRKPKRAWWRRKRWWAPGLLWLLALYPPSVGPACYFTARGWVSAPTLLTVYAPVAAYKDTEYFGKWFLAYTTWWSKLGDRHRRGVYEWP